MSLSRPTTLLSRSNTTQLKADAQISLVDRTRSDQDDAARQGSEAQSPPETPTHDFRLRKRLTNHSANLQETLRREINRQRYARFSQDRYRFEGSTSDPSSPLPPGGQPVLSGGEGGPGQKGYFKARAKTLLNRKKRLGRAKDERDTVVDVLYENQRGAFLFGIPKYSASSLLPTDPKPWQNADFRTSASDIRNAQVPDPSWEWVWKSWYVDMSHDVDEEGWEYSFAFVGHGGSAFAWHGNHPWFHSFVRRRRWIRLRKRRTVAMRPREKAHELSADYFTIHTKNLRPASLTESRAPSSSTANILARYAEPEMTVDEMEITNIADLFLALRRANVDREKISAVQRFIEQGGDELAYLSESMEEIMSMFVFQSGRRQLLRLLSARHDEIHATQDDLALHKHEADDSAGQGKHDVRVRNARDLLAAIHAAEEHVGRLEYWSDMKDVYRSSGNEEQHPQPSFKNKQAASDGVKPLHCHPEHGPAQSEKSTKPEADDASEATKPPLEPMSSPEEPMPLSRTKTQYFDAESEASDDLEDAIPEEPFVPAPESTSEVEGKGERWEVKGDIEDFARMGASSGKRPPDTHGHSTVIANDQLEELVPESTGG